MVPSGTIRAMNKSLHFTSSEKPPVALPRAVRWHRESHAHPHCTKMCHCPRVFSLTFLCGCLCLPLSRGQGGFSLWSELGCDSAVGSISGGCRVRLALSLEDARDWRQTLALFTYDDGGNQRQPGPVGEIRQREAVDLIRACQKKRKNLDKTAFDLNGIKNIVLWFFLIFFFALITFWRNYDGLRVQRILMTWLV